MKLREETIQRLAEKIVNDLAHNSLINIRRDRGAVVAAVVTAVNAEMAKEQQLEKDAEKLLNENLAALGKAGAEIDRRKMLTMIKSKLAKERKIVL